MGGKTNAMARPPVKKKDKHPPPNPNGNLGGVKKPLKIGHPPPTCLGKKTPKKTRCGKTKKKRTQTGASGKNGVFGPPVGDGFL